MVDQWLINDEALDLMENECLMQNISLLQSTQWHGQHMTWRKTLTVPVGLHALLHVDPNVYDYKNPIIRIGAKNLIFIS